MQDSGQVRRATLDDLEVLAGLFDGYRQFYRQAADLAGARAFIAARLTGAESVILLAQAANQVAGFTQLYPSFSSVRMQRLWVLNDLFVDPAWRGHGFGAALLRAAQDWARSTQACGLFLETAQDNPAQQLYEALGWRRDPGTVYYFWTATADA